MTLGAESATGVSAKDLLAAAKQSMDAGEHQKAIQELTQALTADDKQGVVRDIFASAIRQARICAREGSPCMGEYIQFVLDELKDEINPVNIHTQLAWTYQDAKYVPKAQEHLVISASLAESENDWKAITWILSHPVFYATDSNETASFLAEFSPIADDTEKKSAIATGFINAALRIISSSDPAKGIVIAAHVESLSSGLPELGTTVEFLKVLARARKCEAAAEWDKLQLALHSAGRMASSDDTLCKTLYEMAYDIARKRASAGEFSTGRAVSNFIANLSQTGVAPWTFHTQMARLDTSLVNATGVQYHLANAAPHIASDRQAHDWASMAVWAASRAAESDEIGADMIRQLASVLQKDEQQRVFMEAVVNFAGDCITGFHPKKGDAFIHAIEDHAPAGLFEKIAFLKAVANARSLLANEKNDKALSVLRLANQLAGMFPEYKESFYNISLDAAKQQLRMKDSKLALEYLEFILSGPGKDIDHFSLNNDAAYLHALLGNFPDAKFHLLEAASAADLEAKAKAWADRAWFVVDRCRDSAASSALFNELKDVAPPAAKPLLIGLSMQGCRRLLVSNLWPKGAAILSCIQAADAPSSETQAELQFLTHLSHAHTFARQQKYDESVQEMSSAFSMSQGIVDKIEDVCAVCLCIVRARAQWQDKFTCERLLKFAQDGPGKYIPATQLHRDIANIWMDLEHFEQAGKHAILAAEEAQNDNDWIRLKGTLCRIANWPIPRHLLHAMLDTIIPLAKTTKAREAVGLARANVFVCDYKPADAEAALLDVLPETPQRDGSLMAMAYRITLTYARLKQIDNGVRMFQLAEALSEALPENERDDIYADVFYHRDGTRIPTNLHLVLEKAARDASDAVQRARLLTLFGEAAGANGAADEGIAFLTEMNATADAYVQLVRQLVMHSYARQTVKAVNAIPAHVLQADPAAIQELQQIWPPYEVK